MYMTIKRIYERTGNVVYVQNAVKKGWITKEQFKAITGSDYPGTEG